MVQIFKVCKVQIFTIFMEQILPACIAKIGSSTIVQQSSIEFCELSENINTNFGVDKRR